MHKIKLQSNSYKKIMIFGRSGSGKSTFASLLSEVMHFPLYHLDKYFFTKKWQERAEKEFMAIQQELVNQTYWIIDGNSTRSLETRWAQADLVIFFNYKRLQCLLRLIKRRFFKRMDLDDRAEQCPEVLRWQLIKYMWTFERRVGHRIQALQKKYPNAEFIEIKNDKQLAALFEELKADHYS